MVARKFSEYVDGVADLRQLGRTERRDGMLVLAEMAIAEYVKEVREGSFPGPDYTYPIKDAELAAVSASDHWKASVDGRPVPAGSSRRS